MTDTLRAAALLVGLSASTTAWADTWIYHHPSYIGSSEVTALQSTLTGVGATVTTSTSAAWPSSWSGYKLVILLLPGAPFSTTQVSALRTFIDGGGRLVVSADYGYGASWGGANNNVGNLLSSLGTGRPMGTTPRAGTGGPPEK